MIKSTAGAIVSVFLCIGLVTSGSAMAQTMCIVEGSINLQTNGFNGIPATYIQGNIGSDFVNWNINGSSVWAMLGGQSWFLNYSEFGAQETIDGFINGQYVNWRGFNGFFSGYQPCIQ